MGGVVGQVALVGQTLADVLGQDQARLAPVEVQPCQVGSDLEHGAVLAPVHAHRGVLHIADARLCDGATDLIPAFARADVENAHGQELVTAEPVLADRGLVHFQEAQRIGVEHPERCRIAVEQQAELALGLLHPCQRLHALADIGERADHAPLPIHHRHPLAARGHPADGPARQHHAEHFIQHRRTGEGGVEGGLHARCVVAVHAREEIGNRQAVDLHAEDLARQR